MRPRSPGIVLALGIVAMCVGLVRSEAARDLHTLTATGAPRRDRAHRLYRSAWRRRHQHRARQAQQRRNYADATP
jgi:hypothetical protein